MSDITIFAHHDQLVKKVHLGFFDKLEKTNRSCAGSSFFDILVFEFLRKAKKRR